jgi:hypothetical protein
MTNEQLKQLIDLSQKANLPIAEAVGKEDTAILDKYGIPVAAMDHHLARCTVIAINAAADMARDIIRLREALAIYADMDNWRNFKITEDRSSVAIKIYSDLFTACDNGWEIAEKALKETEASNE